MSDSKPETPTPQDDAPRKERAHPERPEDLQPAATGGNQGSPAAPAMPQSVKTRHERGGRS